jgi:hypothetical protein
MCVPDARYAAGFCPAGVKKHRKAERRFPPPWSVDELEACFVVKDGADVLQVLQVADVEN